MKKLMFSTAIVLLLFSTTIFAELVDGPANVREAPNGKILFSLNNDVKVYSKPSNNDWFYLSLRVFVKENDVIDGKIIKKDALLYYDLKDKEIGKVVTPIVSARGKAFFHNNYLKFYVCEIRGYLYKDNIQKSVKPDLSNIDPILLKLLGKWVSQEYIDAIRTTKSPLKASNSITHWPTFELFQDDRDLVFSATTTDFHQRTGDGVSSFTKLSVIDTYHVVCGKSFPEYAKIFDLRVIDAPVIEQIELIDSAKKRTAVYQRMKEDDIEKIVNKLLLAGIYVDNKGQKYIFNENSTVIWPNRTFKYKIALDVTIDSPDKIFMVNAKDYPSGTAYCFEISGNVLKLFNIKYDKNNMDIVIREKQPFLILTKTN